MADKDRKEYMKSWNLKRLKEEFIPKDDDGSDVNKFAF